MKSFAIWLPAVILAVFLTGCGDEVKDPVPPMAAETVTEIVVETSETEPQTNEAEQVDIAAEVATSVEAVDRPPAEVAVGVEVENRVVGQETPIGDNPVMNPAGETLIRTAQVTFPDGGERIEVGKDYEIRWESEGIKALNLEVHQFGRRIDTLAERVLAVEGSYAWVPTATLLRGNDFAQLTIVLVDADTGVTHGSSPEAFMLLPQQ